LSSRFCELRSGETRFSTSNLSWPMLSLLLLLLVLAVAVERSEELPHLLLPLLTLAVASFSPIPGGQPPELSCVR